jgi:hypothetical protein
MEKLDTYYDHYKESNSFRLTALSRRNRSFVYLCVLEAISFMLIKNPDFICALLNDVVRKELEATILFSNCILQTLVWVLIAYVLVRYVQDVLYVERQYKYLSTLEKKISLLLEETDDKNIFTREGDNYIDKYPMVLNFIDIFYKVLAPILFMAINVVHIVQEWNSGIACAVLIVDTVICVAIFVITWFYFFEIHDKMAEWFKKCKPIGWLAKMLRNLLKEV